MWTNSALGSHIISPPCLISSLFSSTKPLRDSFRHTHTFSRNSNLFFQQNPEALAHSNFSTFSLSTIPFATVRFVFFFLYFSFSLVRVLLPCFQKQLLLPPYKFSRVAQNASPETVHCFRLRSRVSFSFAGAKRELQSVLRIAYLFSKIPPVGAVVVYGFVAYSFHFFVVS